MYLITLSRIVYSVVNTVNVIINCILVTLFWSVSVLFLYGCFMQKNPTFTVFNQRPQSLICIENKKPDGQRLLWHMHVHQSLTNRVVKGCSSF